MLSPLAQHATRAGLAFEPGFAKKKARWALDFSADGSFEGISPLDPTAPDKPAAVELAGCPSLSGPEMKALGRGWRHFAVDDLRAALGWDPDGDADGKAARHRERFAAWLREAATAGAAPAAVAAAFESPATVAAMVAAAASARGGPKPAEVAAIRVGGSLLHERPAVVAWWRARYREVVALRRAKAGAADDGRPSLVDGSATTPVKTHPVVRGLASVGGRTSGCSLASSDKAAFRHYGLSQGEHHPASGEQAAAYVAALEERIAAGRPLGRARLLAWDDAGGDPLARLFDPGAPASTAGEAFLMTVSGAAARVMVRDWRPVAAAGLNRAVEEWFEDLAIADAWTGGVVAPVGLARLAAAITPPRRPPGPIFEALLSAAIGGRGTPIPAIAIEAAAAAQASAFLRGEGVVIPSSLESPDYDPDRPPTWAEDWILRAALTGAAMRRNGGGADVVQIGLKEDHPSPYYQAGRLGALLHHARQIVDFMRVGGGIGKTNPSPVDYAKMVRTYDRYLDSLRRLDAARHARLVAMLTDVYASLDGAPPTSIPGTVQARQLFNAGFYNQQLRLATGFGEPTPTDQGFLARSRGEAAMINRVGACIRGTGFAIEHEPTLPIPGSNSYLRPDVRINRPGARPIYVEHQGMRDVPSYRRRQNEKLAIYASMGIRPPGADGDSACGVLLTTSAADVNDGFAAFAAILAEAIAGE